VAPILYFLTQPAKVPVDRCSPNTLHRGISACTFFPCSNVGSRNCTCSLVGIVALVSCQILLGRKRVRLLVRVGASSLIGYQWQQKWVVEPLSRQLGWSGQVVVVPIVKLPFKYTSASKGVVDKLRKATKCEWLALVVCECSRR